MTALHPGTLPGAFCRHLRQEMQLKFYYQEMKEQTVALLDVTTTTAVAAVTAAVVVVGIKIESSGLWHK